MSQKDYLKTGDKKTRPILSIYELSNVITSLAKSIYEDKSVESYLDEDNINDFLNPAHIAFELLSQGKYDAYINRYSEIVKFSELYVDPIYTDLIENYFHKQKNITSEIILKSLNLVK